MVIDSILLYWISCLMRTGFFHFIHHNNMVIVVTRRYEKGTGTEDARRVRTTVPTEEPRPGAQVVQRLDMAG